MRKYIVYIFLLTLVSCNKKPNIEDTGVVRTTEYKAEIIEFLKMDKQYKLSEENCLREIAIAQDNNDEEAYRFFFAEYMDIPRMPIEDWMREEPGFYERKSAKQVIAEYRQKAE